MIAVDIQYAAPGASIPEPPSVERWVHSAFAPDAPGELTVRIVDSNEIQQLNADFRAIDRATNVLAFPADWEARPGVPYIGDIAICAPVVIAEALAQQKTASAHWAHMVIHGALHLQGYDHQTDEDAEAMESYEVALLAQLGFPNPYTHSKPINTAIYQEQAEGDERRTTG